MDVSSVKTFFEDNPDSHVRSAAEQLGLSVGKVWTTLRKKLSWKPYRPHLATVLFPSNMESRLAACALWLKQEEDWFERVILADEMWFSLLPYRVEAAKTTAAPLVVKFGVKAGGDSSAYQALLLVFWGLLVPGC